MNINYICDVIVLTWNQLDIIKSFVESFLLNTTLPTRLIIIDNGSRDGTKDYLSSLRDTSNCKFEIILNKENKGACKGRNQGIVLSNAPYICVVDNDVAFTKDWLNEIILIFEGHKNIDILSPNSNALGTRLPKNGSLQEFAQQLREKHKGIFVEIPFCISFCMVIRREVIDKIGGFSEEFSPMFFEDTDYSMKAQKAGYLIGLAKGTYVWHKEHGSSKQMGKKGERFFEKNRETFQKKWGKILRIAWIVNSDKELIDGLDKAIGLTRDGNFVTLFAKNVTKFKPIILEKNNYIEPSIKLIKYRNLFELAWKILKKKKKKKYEPIINKNKFIQRIFGKLGYNVLNSFDKNKIEKIKKSLK